MYSGTIQATLGTEVEFELVDSGNMLEMYIREVNSGATANYSAEISTGSTNNNYVVLTNNPSSKADSQAVPLYSSIDWFEISTPDLVSFRHSPLISSFGLAI